MPVKGSFSALGRHNPPAKARSSPAKRNGAVSNGSVKPAAKAKPNGSILNFFKKEEQGLFFEDKPNGVSDRVNLRTFRSEVIEDQELYDAPLPGSNESDEERYHENGGSLKRRKISPIQDSQSKSVVNGKLPGECSPPPPVTQGETPASLENGAAVPFQSAESQSTRRNGPFEDDSDSEVDESFLRRTRRRPPVKAALAVPPEMNVAPGSLGLQEDGAEDVSEIASLKTSCPENAVNHISEGKVPEETVPPTREEVAVSNMEDFEEFEGMVDFDDEELEGEEYQERKYMAEQRRIERAEAGFEGDMGGYDDFPDEELLALAVETETDPQTPKDSTATCPICQSSLAGISDHEASVHVNNCLDGNPTPLPKSNAPPKVEKEVKLEKARPRFQRPAKPGQENPIVLDSPTPGPKSAFSALMSNHAEDTAWATAAAAENASRGKPAFQRTCPFYKIMPGMSICVDAFRYGAVRDCRAYFLSHFHSDHYIGLTANWSHGPIFCSRVTANLVRTQLRVDPKYVVDLEFDEKREVPGTQGVFVTMIPANHCPGSSLFLFEKVIGKGKNPKVQRILHCGDFRACKSHIEHPLLKPEVVDSITGNAAQQKIDICYLDTTYLNPKYAFPCQEDVIKACADMCVSLNRVRADESDGWEQMKRDRAGAGMAKFVQKEPPTKEEEPADGAVDQKEKKADPSRRDAMAVSDDSNKPRGRLLVVVGTYSIGKERVCLGIAKALDSKIYAPPSKQRICACLEDSELNARLTNNPREAQVHMTPLFEIRADTLDDYLKDYRGVFSRAVGFRPTGWNYRPPNSRLTESPAVQTVLKSQNWRSAYSMKDLVPQRGSTGRASCFGVPYSEHSSFRELTMFCCALRIDKVVPTVNVGSAKSRERMRGWVERWAVERKRNGLFRPGEEEGCEW